ncbi:MAG: Kojibiose phosphorylase, partial [Lachnospiraceae bacterium]|nr:Kojibiose phosphorylase [Lachnospiraceae bacterium]
MAKIADIYYNTDPWRIIEKGFNPAYSLVSESIFSLGNEFMGVRGYFDEGYSGENLIGSYFNGVYETQGVEASAYKGIIDKTEFIVNSVDWLYLRIQVDGEIVDLNQSDFRNFKRELNLRTGVLNRSYIWVLKDGRELQLEFERFLSMNDAHFAGQRINMTALNFSGEVVVTAGLDFTNQHHMVSKNLWDCKERNAGEKWCSIQANTVNTDLAVFSCCHFEGAAKKEHDLFEKKRVLKEFTFSLEQGKAETLTRVIMNLSQK